LAATALVTALAVGALALRTEPADTSDAVPSLAGTVGAGATSAGAVAVATGPLETPYQSLDPIAGPTPEPTPEPTRERTPAPVATAPPTAKPPKPPKTPRPEPTDSWHTDWTPPPGFVGSLTVTDGCFHTDGTEQVIFTAEYDSPVELTAVRISTPARSSSAGISRWVGRTSLRPGSSRAPTTSTWSRCAKANRSRFSRENPASAADVGTQEPYATTDYDSHEQDQNAPLEVYDFTWEPGATARQRARATELRATRGRFLVR
jgi:hypothetical protein